MIVRRIEDVFDELYNYSETLEVINTHSHHGEAIEEGYNLDSILRNSYVNWIGEDFNRTPEVRQAYLKKVRYNSYFVWLNKGINATYGLKGSIDENNWDKVSSIIYDANKDKDFHLEVLKNKCNYEKVVLDAFWKPGSDNGLPELFSPSLRLDMLIRGYDEPDHNGNRVEDFIENRVFDIDDYINKIANLILSYKDRGTVSLKLGLAYERDLNFKEWDKERAQYAISRNRKDLSKEDIRAFEDYVFYRICEIAASIDMPIQCHLGLGQLKGTSAMEMEEVIRKNPDTSFVLFHGSYPWLHDILGLAHNYSNVYPDICWLPLISTSAAERMLEELIEVTTADKISWGCDTWTSEESYGALLAARYVISSSLARMIMKGYLDMAGGKYIMKRILYENPKEIYF